GRAGTARRSGRLGGRWLADRRRGLAQCLRGAPVSEGDPQARLRGSPRRRGGRPDRRAPVDRPGYAPRERARRGRRPHGRGRLPAPRDRPSADGERRGLGSRCRRPQDRAARLPAQRGGARPLRPARLPSGRRAPRPFPARGRLRRRDSDGEGPVSEYELERGTILEEDVGVEPEEELWTDATTGDPAGWFCVATDPFPCPAEGCPLVALYMTAAHL